MQRYICKIPDNGAGDDDDDIDLVRVDPKEIERVFGSGSSSSKNVPDLTQRPIVIVDSINKRFKQDPVEAVISNINPRDDPEAVERWNFDGKIQRMVEVKERAEKRLEEQWATPEKRFLNLIRDKLGIKTNPLWEKTANIDYTNKGKASGIELETAPESGTEPKFKLETTPATEQQKRDYQYSKDVESVLFDSDVQGMYAIDNGIYAGIREACAHLLILDHTKFYGKNKLEHFLKDEDVMTMFASVVCSIIAINRIITPKVYQFANSITRRTNEEVGMIKNAMKLFVWDDRLGGFKIGNSEEIEQNKQIRRQNRRSAFPYGGRYY